VFLIVGWVVLVIFGFVSGFGVNQTLQPQGRGRKGEGDFGKFSTPH